MNDESRPGAASESFAGADDASSIRRRALDDLDHTHVAWLAGFQIGYSEGRKSSVEEMARALLHQQAAEMAGVAVETARRRGGESWAQAIREQAEDDA